MDDPFGEAAVGLAHRVLPQRLTQVDALSCASHKLLRPGDRVYYLGEYVAGAGHVSPTNDLIHNFKIRPSALRGWPARRRHKEQAIGEIAAAFTRHFSALDATAVVVPIPTSKLPADPDYDDRLLRTLRVCRSQPMPPVRELIKQKRSTTADHAAIGRQSFRHLLANCYVDDALSLPRPSLVILFDDVLTEGKHFKVCQRLLRNHYGDIPVVGFFVARTIPQRHYGRRSGQER